MEMQSSFIHISMPKSSPLYIIIGIIGTIIFLAFSIAAQAPVKVTVEAGKQSVIRPNKAVNRSPEQFDSVPGGIAVGSINSDSQLVIEGLTEGTARIVFNGTLRAIDIAAPNEMAVSFKAIYDVTVLPRKDLDFKVRPLSISKGRSTPYTIGYLMSPGPEFYDLNAEGEKWRNLRYEGGDDGVATGKRAVKGNELKIIIKGISDGRTTLTLRGERKVGNTWRPVERKLNVKVGTGIKPRNNPADNAGANDDASADEFNGEESKPAAEADAEANDAVIEAMSRRLEQLQVSASKADLEQFVDYIKQEIKKEIERRPTRRYRLTQLEIMLENASEELRDFKETADQASPAAKIWSKIALEFGVARGGLQQAVLSCPANPKREFLPPQPKVVGSGGKLYFGNDKYQLFSSVCHAAVHAGMITFESGGKVMIRFVELTEQDEQFSMATGRVAQNGVIASGLLTRSVGGFVFVKQ